LPYGGLHPTGGRIRWQVSNQPAGGQREGRPPSPFAGLSITWESAAYIALAIAPAAAVTAVLNLPAVRRAVATRAKQSLHRPVPREQFRAVFSASAFHWVDPKVSWQKVADALVPGGTLALLQYFGLEEPRSKLDQDATFDAMRKVAPGIAADWPAYRDLDGTLAGIERRSANVSEVWAWLGSYEIGRDYAASLFSDVQAVVMPKLIEHTPDELNALLRTMSFYARLSPAQSQALEREYEAIYQRLSRPIRASTVGALVTSRRTVDP
jgi:hypothetical protein